MYLRHLFHARHDCVARSGFPATLAVGLSDVNDVDLRQVQSAWEITAPQGAKPSVVAGNQTSDTTAGGVLQPETRTCAAIRHGTDRVSVSGPIDQADRPDRGIAARSEPELANVVDETVELVLVAWSPAA